MTLKNKFVALVLLLIGITAFMSSCEKTHTPRPRGYFRIAKADKNPRNIETPCGFSFDIPEYSQLEIVPGSGIDTCWFNIKFKRYNARVHLTYFALDNNLNKLVEDAYQFAFQHEQKASAIGRSAYSSSDNKSAGLIYDLSGNVASSVQFYVTDSSSHFLRGGLYFENFPNEDSLAPVMTYLREDVVRMMESIQWNNTSTSY
ncbi:MAG: hypothetical protein ACPGED_03770 [Flavobacteriales bacterium]